MFDNKKIKLAANQSLVLKEYDKFWMITSGEVDVFYVNVDENGEYLSALKYLYSAKSGELLFSLVTSKEEERHTKLLIVSKGSSLVAINKNKLLEIEHFFLKSMIDNWVLKTVEVIQQVITPRLYEVQDPLETAIYRHETVLFPSKGLAWSVINKGQVQKYSSTQIVSAKETTWAKSGEIVWQELLGRRLKCDISEST